MPISCRAGTVVGEAGVGKSRLFHEFVNSHRAHGWLILESASVSYGKASAYMPLIELLKSYLKIEDRDDVRAVSQQGQGTILTMQRMHATTHGERPKCGRCQARPTQGPAARYRPVRGRS